jgi:hypothetical protein
MDRERTRALLADILGPVVLRRDSEGEWAEMEEPAQRLALAGSTLLTVLREPPMGAGSSFNHAITEGREWTKGAPAGDRFQKVEPNEPEPKINCLHRCKWAL